MVKIDLSQAYFHVPMAEAHRPFLRVAYKGELLHLTGLSSAPRLFSASNCWHAEILRGKGIRVLFRRLTFSGSKLLQAYSSGCGKPKMFEKSWLGGKSKEVYSNTKSKYRIPGRSLGLEGEPNEHTSIKKTLSLQALRQKERCKLRRLQNMLGQLNFASFGVPRRRLNCRCLQIFLRKFRKCSSEGFGGNYLWLGETSKCIAIHKQPVTRLRSPIRRTGNVWKVVRKTVRWHSNMKAMYTVYRAIRIRADHLRGSHILLQTDSRTLVA